MARGQPVNLATRSFPTKGQAAAFFKSMLNRYRPGDRVADDDAADLRSLLDRHPESARKIGSGIDHFEVMAAEYDTQCFCVVRTDMTRDDFSYRQCLGPKSGIGKG
jgi:hypothetical protein